MSIKIPKKLLGIGSIFALLIAVLLLSDPNNMPSVALVVPFILLFLCLYIAATALFSVARRWQGWARVLHVTRPRIAAGLIAGFVVLLLILQSIGQLSTRDALTVGLICVITYIYAAKFSIARTGS